MAPTVRMGSGVASTMATGAVPRRIASASTADEDEEPRPPGITSTRPATFRPRCGWE